MTMKTAIVNKIRQADDWVNSAYLDLWGERKSLMIFLFHAILRDEGEYRAQALQPAQAMTLRHFCQFVEYYQTHHYRFISPDDVLNGLDRQRNYALITFDDGYYNNQWVLPVLKRYQAPALFFICTDYVKNRKSFWWDVYHREKTKRGMAAPAISEQINALRALKTNEEIERYMADEFGKEALAPRGDIDRPFTSAELRDFAREELVFLGNHTSRHPYLPRCSPEEITSAMREAQEDLYEITGSRPVCSSYPFGGYSPQVIEITKQIGFKLGMAVDNRKNYLPMDLKSDEALRLGRFVLQDNDQILQQCRLCRADIRLTKIVKTLTGKGEKA